MELIDLNELEKFQIRENNYDRENGSADFIYGVETVIEYAKKLPKVDAVPVVQCGECKNCTQRDTVYDRYCEELQRNCYGMEYCSYGEPRTPPAE